MRWVYRGMTLALVATMAPGILMPVPATELARSGDTERPTAVSVRTADLTNIDEVLHAFGQVRPARVLHLPMPDQPAPVAEILVRAGDRVHKGQLLARLDTTEAARDLMLSETELQGAHADVTGAAVLLRLAETEVALREETLARLLRLAQNGASTVVQRDEAEGALNRARLERDAARSALDKARAAEAAARHAHQRRRDQLENTQLTAPEAGLVLSVSTEVGMSPQPGSSLISLASGGEMEAVLDLAPSALSQVRPGDPVRMWLAGGEEIEGEVITASASQDGGRLGAVNVRLLNGARPVAGSSLRGEIVIDRRVAMMVPMSALVPLPTGPGIMQVVADRAVATPVMVSVRLDGKQAEIVGGLPAGARYVERAGHLLSDGALLGTAATGRDAARTGLAAAQVKR